jgi:hypothetical protein
LLYAAEKVLGSESAKQNVHISLGFELFSRIVPFDMVNVVSAVGVCLTMKHCTSYSVSPFFVVISDILFGQMHVLKISLMFLGGCADVSVFFKRSPRHPRAFVRPNHCR